MQNKRNGLLVVCGLAVMLLLGCQNDEIRSYRVPKPEATRLLAVIIPRGDDTWFFKLVGPEPQIDEQKELFDQFIRSVRFVNETDRVIDWTVPGNWRAGPKSDLRYATFYLGQQDHPLELTVFKFSGLAGSVLENVNRWRRQIGLRDIQDSELGQFSRNLKLDCGPSILVDMTNRRGRNTGPMAGPDIVSRPSGSRPRLQYDKPEGWKEGPDPKHIRTVVFEIAGGAAEAGVTALASAGGTLLDNVNRWRREVDLKPIDKEQLDKDLRQLKVAGTTAPYVDLAGPESAGRPPKRTLGVVLPRGEQTWFFTLKGPADVVEKQKPAFEAFVKSVRFDGSGGANHE